MLEDPPLDDEAFPDPHELVADRPVVLVVERPSVVDVDFDFESEPELDRLWTSRSPSRFDR